MSLYPSYLLVSSKRYKLEEPRPVLYRVLHENELPEGLHTNPPNMPEVRSFFPNHFSPFGKGWQLLSKAMNPLISPEKWTVVYGSHLWISNNNGFDDDRANFILGKDLDHELPKVEALTCGGNVLTGHIEGDELVVETLDWHDTPPTADWLRARPWFCTYAVTLGNFGIPRRFPEGLQPSGEVVPVIHPLIADPTRYRITIPMWRVVKWSAAEMPDPYRVYL